MNELTSPESWKCAICCELLHKPVANVCGHLFCFWCLHRAMSPFTESKCPLCRTKYGHLPNVISKLHSFLKAVFPEEYAQREAENAEEEQKEEIASPDVSRAIPATSTPTHIAKEDFLCDICKNLLYKPTVLTCGHVVCGGCLDKRKIPSSDTPSGSGQYECACGVCGQPLAHKPQPCRQLEDLILSVFGEEYTTRDSLERDKAVVEIATSTGPAAQENKNDQPRESEEEALEEAERIINSTPAATATTVSETTTGSPNSEQLTGPHAVIYNWLQGKDYTHFGIGCDCCGQFPITGRRYRCTACPEAVGFDLCGNCYDRGVSSDPNAVVGRFNQRHTPDHKMELCRPRLTSLHMLRAANPELSFDQLMYLLQVSSERDNEGGNSGQGNINSNVENNVTVGGRGGGELGGAAEEGQQQQQGENNERDVEEGRGAAAELEENEIPMPHGRGPRPVQDSSAQWPSPSSFNTNNDQVQPHPNAAAPPTGEEDSA